MKKILLIIPFAICLVLSSISSFVASADDTPNYVTFEEFVDSVPSANVSKYFFFKYESPIPNSDNWCYYRSFFIRPFSDSDIVEITEDSNGIFTFYCDRCFYYDIAYNTNFGSYGRPSGVNTLLGNEFKYDSKNGTLIFPYEEDPVTIHDVKTTLIDESLFGDLYVKFTPELKGLVDYKVDINGKKYSTEGLEFSITNKSSRDYQFAVFIVNKGEQIEYINNYFDDAFDKEEDGYSTGLFYSNKPIFAYVKNLWFETVFQGRRTKVNAPSAWHLITSGREIHDTIYWHQMKLEKGHEYDVVVVACQVNPFHTIESDCPLSYVGDIRFQRFENTPFLAGDEYPFETYRSSFTVVSNTPFDVKNKESLTGAIAYDPDGNIEDLFNNLEGYYDSRNDNDLVLTDSGSKFSDFSSNGSHDYNYTNSFKSDGDYRYLLSNSRSFFSFISAVLGYFPISILSVVNLGFWAILILSLIRRIK